jgi:hypothetical protein
MKIMERLRLNTWISLCGVIFMMITVAWSSWDVYRANRNMLLTDKIQKVTLERIFLRDDYLLNPSEQTKVQWYEKSETLRAFREKGFKLDEHRF